MKIDWRVMFNVCVCLFVGIFFHFISFHSHSLFMCVCVCVYVFVPSMIFFSSTTWICFVVVCFFIRKKNSSWKKNVNVIQSVSQESKRFAAARVCVSLWMENSFSHLYIAHYYYYIMVITIKIEKFYYSSHRDSLVVGAVHYLDQNIYFFFVFVCLLSGRFFSFICAWK